MLDFMFSLEPGGIAPMRMTEGSAAFDIFVPESESRVGVYPGHVTSLDLRLKVAIPEGHAGIMLPRSGVGSKKGLALANTFGLIDSDYRDSLLAKLVLGPAGSEKTPTAPIILRAWEPILQLFIVPLPKLKLMEVSRLPDPGTRTGGFGSTDKNRGEKDEQSRSAGDNAEGTQLGRAIDELLAGQGSGKAEG